MNQRQEHFKREAEREARELALKQERDTNLARERAEKALRDANITPPVEATPKWYTLGSMASGDGYRLLVTLTSKGAGIERIELVDQVSPNHFRYRSLAHRGGYLGYLAPTIEPEGLRIHTVPTGSAAALATSRVNNVGQGLLADDIITKVNDTAITSPGQLALVLEKIKAGSTVSVSVLRGKPALTPSEIEKDSQPLSTASLETEKPASASDASTVQKNQTHHPNREAIRTRMELHNRNQGTSRGHQCPIDRI